MAFIRANLYVFVTQLRMRFANFSLVEIGPVILEKKKMWEMYDNNDDDGQIVIRKAHLRASVSGDLITTSWLITI